MVESGRRDGGGFPIDKWKIFEAELEQWDVYMQQQKMSWFFVKENNLEKRYFGYIKGNLEAAAAWGFILQQEDWNNCADYYVNEAKEKVTGKPYYFLKYYCAKTKLGEVDEVYKPEIGKYIDRLCPPER